jgi:hypothetical protein
MAEEELEKAKKEQRKAIQAQKLAVEQQALATEARNNAAEEKQKAEEAQRKALAAQVKADEEQSKAIAAQVKAEEEQRKAKEEQRKATKAFKTNVILMVSVAMLAMTALVYKNELALFLTGIIPGRDLQSSPLCLAVQEQLTLQRHDAQIESKLKRHLQRIEGRIDWSVRLKGLREHVQNVLQQLAHDETAKVNVYGQIEEITKEDFETACGEDIAEFTKLIDESKAKLEAAKVDPASEWPCGSSVCIIDQPLPACSRCHCHGQPVVCRRSASFQLSCRFGSAPSSTAGVSSAVNKLHSKQL